MAKTKETIAPDHRDLLGRPLKLEDCVAVSYYNNLRVAKIIKINPKMLQVRVIGNKARFRAAEILKYPHDMVLLDGPDVIAHLLKISGE
jgi:hypothetical protein